LNGSSIENKNIIAIVERRELVRDDHDSHVLSSQLLHHLKERVFRVRIKVRIRLVKHDEIRVSIDGAGESNAAPLSARKDVPARAKLSVISIRKRSDQVLDAS
jgi:hypothetical protein